MTGAVIVSDSESESESEAILRKPEMKVCQTDQLILISIMEPDISEEEVLVSIEPRHLSIELTRSDIANPILSGKLFGHVNKDHCRVRVKDDSIVIKLRKSEKGRWKCILEEGSSEIRMRVSPETCVRPIRTAQVQDLTDPIEPSEPPKAVPIVKGGGSAGGGGVTVLVGEPARINDKGDDVIKPSESSIMGVFEQMKKFHDSLYNPNTSFVYQQETADEEDPFDIDGPLVKRPDPREV